MADSAMLTFSLEANRTNAEGSLVHSKQTELTLDTSMAGRLDALNPVELLLAALSACIIKGIERVSPTLNLEFDSVHVALTAHRPKDEAKLEDIAYVVTIGTDADQAKLDLLHKNLMKFGTIYNTIKSGTKLSGSVVAKS